MTTQKIPVKTLNWENQKRKLKERYSTLTDQDLNFEQGKMGDMITRLQRKIGKSKHELYQIITRL